MNLNEFWQLIDTAKTEATCLNKYDIVVERLGKRSLNDIFAFQQHVDQLMLKSYTSTLWAAAYLLMGGCSDDCFDYFRGWLILQGQTFYDGVVKNPDTLADLLSDEMLDYGFECEEFLSTAFTAYEEKTGNDDFYDVYYEKQEPMMLPDLEFEWDEDDEDTIIAILPNLYDWLED